jgi:hypothetical protein
VIAGKVPNPKLQAPGKFQITNFKCPKETRPLQLGTSVIEICLELGIWSLADGAQKFEMQV